MISHLGVLVVSLVALVRGADYLVEYAARVARRFSVSELIVGLLITSVGTSLPELSSSLAAALAGSPGLVIGNVVGSNIANIGLVLGVAAAMRPLATESRMHDRDGFILVASAALLFAFSLDNRIGRVDAALFIVGYAAYVAFATRSDRGEIEHRFKDFLKFVFDFEYAAPVLRGLSRRGTANHAAEPPREVDRQGLGREVVVILVSLAAVIVGARYTVAEAIWLAELARVPENLIGLSVVAIGTSLPELLVSVAAARQGKSELVVGNVLGSNIANGLLIVGLAALLRPLDVAERAVVYTIPIMIFFSLALLHAVRSDWKVTRAQGFTAIVAYAAFLVAAFIGGWG